MKYSKIASVVLGLIFVLVPNARCGQKIQFKHLTVRDGLSHPYVRCIVQDNIGFMWFGTFDGLNKYDGYKFTVYRHSDADPNSILSNTIRSLYKDPQGNIWIGTETGFSVYDYVHDCFHSYRELGGYRFENIDCLLKDSKGNVWAGNGNNGLIRIDTLEKRVTSYIHKNDDPTSLSNNAVRYLFEDSRQRLWVATLDGGVNVFHEDTKTFTQYTHETNNPYSILGNTILSIAEDTQGVLWFACRGSGVSSINVNAVDTSPFINYTHDPKNLRSLADYSIRTLRADQNGGLWIGTENSGLFSLQKNQKDFDHYQHNPDDPYSLNSNVIFSIYQDRSRDLWIGTYNGGINVIHYTKQAFRHYFSTPNGTNQLNNNTVWKFAEDRKGNIWIATDGGGLNTVDPSTETFAHYDSRNSNLNNNAVLTVCIDAQNELWVGTWSGGFSQFHEQSKSFTVYTHENSGLSNNNVLDIADGRDGTLWLATQGGLNRFDKKTKRFTVYTHENSALISNQLEVVKVDSAGNVLIGSPNGLLILDPKTNTFVPYRHNSAEKNSLSSDFITSFCEENKKTLWIATTNGLNVLNRETQEITRFSKTDGLPNDMVYGVEKDNRGYLWISTNGGLSRFDPVSKSFKNFTIEDGLQENVFIKKSHFKTRDGRLYFGGVNGFNIFHPDEIHTNQTIPPVVITDFQVFNMSVKPAEGFSPLKKNITIAEEITLSYQQNVFSFEFSALNYVASSKCQYAHILEGFEKNWDYVDGRRTATYTNIDPGKYIFRVKGSNDDGIWNEEGTSIAIIITPPFWETAWFRLLGLMFLLGAIVTGHKIRTARIRSRNRELEQHVLERTVQLEAANKELEAFSYSVSHDLRAPLRSIDGFSNAVLEDYAQTLDEKGKYYLQRVRAASQHMEELIDDILNLSRVMRTDMKRTSVNMSNLADSISERLAQTQPDRNVTWVITPGMIASADQNLTEVVLNNLLDNAWKFTGKHPAATIEFGQISKQGQTVYFVRDDGDGFDMRYAGKLFRAFQRMHTPAEFPGTGIGLTTVWRIINRHGGKIWAEAEKDKGATFYFTLS